MTLSPDRPLAVLYEHPDWFRPLFAELDRRGLPWRAVAAAEHHYDPSEEAPPWSLLFNRMSPSAYLRGGGGGVSYTLQYLDHLERLGVRVVNGREAYSTEISKARQLGLLRGLGLPAPPSRVVHRPESVEVAARGLRFPVVVKPNVGGSGAGVRRFAAPEELARAAAAGEIDLGLDGTGLVQEFIPAEAGRIVRVEVLGGRFLYAIRVYTPGDTFNLCPADVCRTVGGVELARAACPLDAPANDLRVEGYTPPPEVVAQVEAIARQAGIEVGGVEYLLDDRDGRLFFYDVNALSNFVADAPRVVGFDPFARLVDYLVEQAEETCATDTGSRFSVAG